MTSCALCDGRGHGTKACVFLGAFLHNKLDAQADMVDLILRFVGEWSPIGCEGMVQCLSISSGGDALCIGTANGSIQVFDARTGEQLQWPLKGDCSESEDIAIDCLDFSLDGKVIAAGDRGGNVRLFHTSTGAPIEFPLRGHRCTPSLRR